MSSNDPSLVELDIVSRKTNVVLNIFIGLIEFSSIVKI